jgi:hypothetical protein
MRYMLIEIKGLSPQQAVRLPSDRLELDLPCEQRNINGLPEICMGQLSHGRHAGRLSTSLEKDAAANDFMQLLAAVRISVDHPCECAAQTAAMKVLVRKQKCECVADSD